MSIQSRSGPKPTSERCVPSLERCICSSAVGAAVSCRPNSMSRPVQVLTSSIHGHQVFSSMNTGGYGMPSIASYVV